MAKVDTLKDHFLKTTLDTTKWDEFTAGSATMTYATTGAQVNFPASSTASTDGDIVSDVTYDVTASSVFVEVLTVPSSSTSANAGFEVRNAAGTSAVFIFYEAGTMYFSKIVGGVQTNVFSTTYNATNHRYWRIRESGGTTYWELLNTSFQVVSSFSATNPVTLTAMYVGVYGICWQNESNPGTFKWRNLNGIVAVQSTKASAAGFPTSVTSTAFANTTVSGRTIVAFAQVQSNTNAVDSVTDNKSNTYTKLYQLAGNANDISVWVSQNITGGSSHTVTVNDAGSVAGGIIAYEVAGLPTTGTILDGSASSTGAHGGVITPGTTAATTNAFDIVFVAGAITTNTAGTWTVGSGYEYLTTTSGSSAGYAFAAQAKLTGITGTQTGTISHSVTNQADTGIIVALSDTAIVSTENEADLVAGSVFTVAGTRVHTAASALSTTANLTAALAKIHSGAWANNGDSVITATMIQVVLGAMSIDASATLTVAGARVHTGVFTNNGDSVFSATALRTAVGVLAINSSATLTADSNVHWHASAAISSSATMTTVGTKAWVAASALSTTANITALLGKIHTGAMANNGDSIIFMGITQTFLVSASLQGNSVAQSDFVDVLLAGALLVAGSVLNIDGQIATVDEDKVYEYKIFNASGTYLTSLSDVITDFNYNQNINTAGNALTIELGRTADFLPELVENLITESTSEDIHTEASEELVAVTDTGTQLGAGGTVDLNYQIEVWVYYGYDDVLVDENGENVVDENGVQIAAIHGSPDGLRLFAGYISSFSARYGQNETTVITCLPYGAELNNYMQKDGDSTTVPYLSVDPSSGLVRGVLDDFNLQGGTTTYSLSSVPESNTTVSYTFKMNTALEGIKKGLELAPSNWWWAVHVGTNVLHFKPQPVDATHTFVLGKHVKDIQMSKTIENIVNEYYFLGGNKATDPDPADIIYRHVQDATSKTDYRPHLARDTDQRITDDDSADVITSSKLASNKDPRWTGTVTVLTKAYEIETIELGQNIGFSNFGNFIDGLVLQIVGYSYTPDHVTMTVDSLLPQPSKRLEDIKRNLNQVQTLDVPDTPT